MTYLQLIRESTFYVWPQSFRRFCGQLKILTNGIKSRQTTIKCGVICVRFYVMLIMLHCAVTSSIATWTNLAILRCIVIVAVMLYLYVLCNLVILCALKNYPSLRVVNWSEKHLIACIFSLLKRCRLFCVRFGSLNDC